MPVGQAGAVLERAVSAAPGMARRELWRSCVAFVILPAGVGLVKLPRRSGSLIARRAATLAGGSEPAAVLGGGLGASGGLLRDSVWRAGRTAGTLAAPSLPRGRRQAL